MFGENRGQSDLETLSDPVIEWFNGQDRRFEGLRVGGRAFRWVRFTGATFIDCDFCGATLECFFADFATFHRCRFDEGFVFESVFAGSRMTQCSMVGATADMCNFNAVAAVDVEFRDTSLRRSRFINARLTSVRFVNCDIRDALFQFSQRDATVFEHTNDEEACF